MSVRFYWDADTCFSWLKREGDEDRYLRCQAVLDAAASGKAQLFTSPWTLTEVLYFNDGRRNLKKRDREQIEAFFQNRYWTYLNLDRWVAAKATELFWEHHVSQKDAIHVASALIHEIEVLHTFDKGLISRSGEFAFKNGAKLKIERPSFQLSLPNV